MLSYLSINTVLDTHINLTSEFVLKDPKHFDAIRLRDDESAFAVLNDVLQFSLKFKT